MDKPYSLVPVRKRGAIVDYAMVDTEDLPKIDGCRFWFDTCGYVRGVKSGPGSRKNKQFGLHRLVMDAPVGSVVDHRNGILTDCRKSELRITDSFGNAQNRIHPPTSASGYRGVYANRKYGWKAVVKHKGVEYYAGANHKTPELANVAAERLRRKLGFLSRDDDYPQPNPEDGANSLAQQPAA